METNDANSYISTTIADKVTDGVRDALAKRVGTQAAENFLLGLAQIRGSLSDAADGAGKIATGLDQASAGATKLSDGADTARHRRRSARRRARRDAAKTASLPAQTRKLADGAAQVADGNRQIAAKGDQIAGVSTKVRTRYDGVRGDLKAQMQSMGLTAEQQSQLLGVYDDLGTPVTNADSYIQKTARDLDRLAAGSRQVADGADQLADGMPALTAGIQQAHDGSAQLSTGATKLSSGATELRTGLGKLRAGSHQLETGLRDGVDKIPALDDETRTRIAKTIGDPVDVRDRAQTAAGSYGAGLAPFFMALAAWVGGYVLFLLVRPLSSRAMAANQTPLRVALGGWYTPALIGLVQTVALFTVVVVAIDIVPAHLPLTLLFLVLCSVTFIAILHMLNAWLGSSGQFLGLVMMVLQLVTAGGTFPWQTIPTPLHWLHHLLPMSYAVDGLRQLMYGGLTGLALRDAAVLALWLVGAVVLTSVAARKQRVWSVKRIHPELAL
jgi:putative membrane protein